MENSAATTPPPPPQRRRRQKRKEKKDDDDDEPEISRASWSPQLEKALTDAMLECHANLRYRSQGRSWSPEGWAKLRDAVNQASGDANMTLQQVKEHESEMKKNYKLVKELRSNVGMGWDNSLCMLATSENIWRPLIAANKKLKRWKRKAFPYYDALDTIFGAKIAAKKENLMHLSDAAATAEANLGNKEEQDIVPAATEPSFPNAKTVTDEQGLNQLVDRPVAQPQPQQITLHQAQIQLWPSPRVQSPASSVTQIPRKRPKCEIASIAELMEEMVAKHDEETSQRLERVQRESEFSISRCMQMMSSLSVLTREEKLKTADLFLNKNYREIFLTIEEDLRVDWLRMKLGSRE